MTPTQTILMCAPGYFSVDYVINHWMKNQTGKVDRALAGWQWEHLRSILSSLIKLAFVPSEPGVPDMVFTANAGLVLGDKVIVSRFASRERQAEEPLVRKWFQQNGYAIADWPRHVAFEGAGDALFDRELPILWFGHGFRSDAAAAGSIEKAIGCRTVSLRLTDPRFYHLDTCFCPLRDGTAVWFPAAFDEYGQRAIREHVPELIDVLPEEAMHFSCNAVVIDRDIVLPEGAPQLVTKLQERGYRCHALPMSEFIKAGGACKCLTMFMPQREKA